MSCSFAVLAVCVLGRRCCNPRQVRINEDTRHNHCESLRSWDTRSICKPISTPSSYQYEVLHGIKAWNLDWARATHQISGLQVLWCARLAAMRYMVFAGGALSELGKACSKTTFVKTSWEERHIDMTDTEKRWKRLRKRKATAGEKL